LDNISTTGNFTISWRSVSGSDYYIIKEIFNNKSNEMKMNDTSVSYRKALNGTYYYKVKSVNSFGESDWGGPVYIEVNTVPNQKPDIPRDLKGIQSNKKGYGAEIHVLNNHKNYYRFPITSVGWSNQEKHLYHFGLGNTSNIDIRVIWPSKIVDELFGINVDQNIVITEGNHIDTIAPARINNLVAVAESDEKIIIAWTVPGDDGWTRNATRYEIRWLNAQINDSNWESAYLLKKVPNPTSANTNQHFTVSELKQDTKYYFAIKTYDEAGNVSPISNVAWAKTKLGNKLLDLNAVTVGMNRVDLSWKIPDLIISNYDIRYSTSRIYESNFQQAIKILDIPEPGLPGDIQECNVTNLRSNTTYYFAIKVILANEQDMLFSEALSTKTSSKVDNSLSVLTSIPLKLQLYNYYHYVMGDYNGDNKPDLMYTTSEYDKVNDAFRNKAIIHFSVNGKLSNVPDVTISKLNNTFAGGQGAAVADLNNDGFDDLIIGEHNENNSQIGKVYIYLGSSSMDANIDYTIDGSEIKGRLGFSILGGFDFNNDTIEDIVVCEFGKLNIYYGSNGKFDTIIDRQLNLNTTNFVLLAAGDFNGDSKNDIVVLCSGNKYVLAYFFNTEKGLMQSPIESEIIETSVAFTIPNIGDLNSDGFDDIIIDNTKDVYVYYGRPDSEWSNSAQFMKFENLKDSGNEAIRIMDINGDRNDDLLIGNKSDKTYYNGIVRVYLGGNNFDNISDKEIAYKNLDYFGKYIHNFGDLNDDGYEDLLIGSEYQQTVIMAGESIKIREDSTPPSKVTDFIAEYSNVGQVTFQWTSPGDDGDVGTATQYEIMYTARYRGFLDTWGQDAELGQNLPIPSTAGSRETHIINNLNPGLKYHFVLRTFDESGNVSEQSNTVIVDIKPGFELVRKFEFQDNNPIETNCNGDETVIFSGYNMGDVNGDNIDDLLLNGGTSCGRLRIFFGNKSFDSVPDFDFIGNNVSQNDLLGVSNCPVNQIYTTYPIGDYNNDRINDFVLLRRCYYNECFFQGSTNLMYQSPNGKIHPDFFDSPGEIENVGDVNGDGFDDFIAFNKKYYSGQIPQNKVSLFLGSSNFKETPDLILYEQGDINQVRSIGDFNKDGFNDIALSTSARCYINNNNQCVEYGSTKVLIFLGGVNIDAYPDINYPGNSVEGIGDCNGDGYDDIAISRTISSNNSQSVVDIYFGETYPSSKPGTSIYEPPYGNYFGTKLYNVGDLNGDTFSDFVIGDVQGLGGNKAKFVYFGSSDTHELSVADFTLFLNDPNCFDSFLNEHHNLSIDFNGDGKSEIIWYGKRYSNSRTYYLIEFVEKDTDNDGIVDNIDPYYNNAPPSEPQLLYPVNNTKNFPFDGTLKWSASDPDDLTLTYSLYLSTTSEPGLFTSNSSSNQFDLSNIPLPPNTYYYWKVVVADSANQIKSSEIYNFVTSAPNIPTAPNYLKVTSVEAGNLLEWAETSDKYCEKIIIERKKSDEDQWKIISEISCNSLTHLDTYNLEPHELYDYRIAMSNVSGTGNYSNKVSVVTYNRIPVISLPKNITFEAKADNELSLSLCYDPDNDEFIFQIMNNNLGLKIDQNKKIISWMPNSDQIGDHTIIIKTQDQMGGVNQKSIVISVVDRTPPELNIPDDIFKNVSSTPVNINTGNASAIDLITTVDNIQISNNAPLSGFSNGETIIKWTAKDEAGNTISNNQRVVVNVIPEAYNKILFTDEDCSLDGVLQATDYDGDNLSFMIVSDTVKGTVSINNYDTGEFSYTPNADEFGLDTFTYIASDDASNSIPATVTLNIKPINDLPTIKQVKSLEIEEDSKANIIFQVSDKETDPKYLIVSLKSSNNEIIPNENIMYGGSGIIRTNTIIPQKNMYGNSTISITVNDGMDTVSTSFNITIKPVNDPPVIEGQLPIILQEDNSKEISLTHLSVYDVDNIYTTEFSLNIQKGDNYTISGNTITPYTNYYGILTVPVSVNDGSINSSFSNITVTVKPVNDSPIITGQNDINLNEDSSLEITLSHLSITDPDSNDFSLKINHGNNYSILDNIITPIKDFDDNLIVPVYISDGIDNSSVFNVIVNITPVNDPPIINSQTEIIMDEDTSLENIISFLNITDIDNTVPDDITITIDNMENYSFIDNKLSPNLNYT